ncbi:MAG: hypothetical protein IMX02_12200 [Limnochordaceae bacterium]|nr:hypothetical protein [Limnochordaceae bacterium]
MSPLWRGFLIFQAGSNLLNLILSLVWVRLGLAWRIRVSRAGEARSCGYVSYLLLSARFDARLRRSGKAWRLTLDVRPVLAGLRCGHIHVERAVAVPVSPSVRAPAGGTGAPSGEASRPWLAPALKAAAASLRGKVVASCVDVHLCVGVGDAMWSALSAGAAYAGLSLTARALGSWTSFERRPRLRVRPLYGRPHLSARGRLEARVRAGWLLLALVKGAIAGLRARKPARTPAAAPQRARAQRAAA